MYVEPDNYFPKDVRKKYGLGEYAKKQKQTTKKTTATKKTSKTKSK